jgi:hypothetical protein
MAYRQYTSCVQPINFISANVVGYTYLLTILGLITAAFISAYATPGGSALVYVLPILIALFIALITFLLWWLYDRLICLGGVVCAIGLVEGHNHPPDLTKAGDDDFTVNIFLAGGPTDINHPKEKFWSNANPPLGKFVEENSAILQVGLHYAQDGSDLEHVKMLHCEFEGSGIRNMLVWANLTLALLIAALVLLLAAGPIGYIIATILWILAALLGVGEIINYFNPLNVGSPADVDHNKGELNPGDLVIIKGDWIYDSLHVGWNEIHAVHDCQIIIPAALNPGGGWPADIGMGLGLDSPPRIQEAVDFWCNALDEATIAQENGSQDNPSLNWVIHPVIDGCTEPVIV